MVPASPPEDLQTPTLAQVNQACIEAALEDLHTCSWGSVVSYDATTQTAHVQLIQRRSYVDADGNRTTERPAPLLDVPVVFPGAGAVSMTWPLAAGDVVLLLFAERALDAWYAGGQEDVDAGDDRHHSLSDAIAIPGLRSAKDRIGGPPPSDALVLTVPSGQTIRLGSKDATKGVARIGDQISIPISALTTALDTHYSVSGAPTGTTVTGTITSASGKVKADD